MSAYERATQCTADEFIQVYTSKNLARYIVIPSVITLFASQAVCSKRAIACKLVAAFKHRAAYADRCICNLGTTNELASLSDRSKEAIEVRFSQQHFRSASEQTSNQTIRAMQQALVLTNDIVQSSLQGLRQHLDVLFALVESLALLDMLVCFAETVSLVETPFSRPILTEGEPVRSYSIKPVDERLTCCHTWLGTVGH